MRSLVVFFASLITAFSFESVYKYAYNDAELSASAAQAQKALKAKGAHLGLIEQSEIFEGDGGLAALKMGYIDILATKAQTIQYIVPSVWVKLEAAKNGDDQPLKSALAKLGFSLVKIKFFKNKTIVILANASAFAQTPTESKTILIDAL
ncbi:MAG: hypothetical protein LBF86_06415 [Helicobacteraceae bacterium]|nr:hypothetical protein [Helicobacteraceae bacterium]